jgi:hypothetical protein
MLSLQAVALVSSVMFLESGTRVEKDVWGGGPVQALADEEDAIPGIVAFFIAVTQVVATTEV